MSKLKQQKKAKQNLTDRKCAYICHTNCTNLLICTPSRVCFRQCRSTYQSRELVKLNVVEGRLFASRYITTGGGGGLVDTDGDDKSITDGFHCAHLKEEEKMSGQ